MNNSPEDSSLAAEEIGALKDHSEPKILAPMGSIHELHFRLHSEFGAN